MKPTLTNLMKLTGVLLLLFSSFASFSQPHFTIDIDQKGVEISPYHYGVFFEDINRSADGGIYAELINNRSFEDAATPDQWTLLNMQGAVSEMTIESENLLNDVQTRALKLKINDLPYGTSYSRLSNEGYWGINLKKGQTYKVSFFARCDTVFNGELTVMLEDEFHRELASTTITGISGEWQKYTCELVPDGNSTDGAFVMTPGSEGTLWLDVVSVFPPTFKNRENGLRTDLAQLVDDMNPTFLRFPGGCFVEGDVLANRFDWKKSIGNIEDRPGHWNLWGYQATDGLGYHEYLQFCEDVEAAPMFVVNVGLAHGDYHPYNDLDTYIQDALYAIEYANGDINTPYGAMRAQAGHPEPFHLKYLEVGNENLYGDHYGDRYIQFYNAIHKKYPEIVIIGDGNSWPFGHPVDLVDEHYYSSPQWFIDNYQKYDSYSRNGNKVYVGEYAVTQNSGLGNLAAAIGEAVFMCGMEKNSDIVPLNSYAPMFVNIDLRNNAWVWNPDMINFNASKVYCTPSYYVQKIFANNIGTVNLQVKDSMNSSTSGIKGAIGMGTWSTGAEYDDVKVVGSDGAVLVDEDFSDASEWSVYNGDWSVQNGSYMQSSTETDCRSTTTSVSDTAYTYTLRARKKNGAEGFLIIFGYQDSDNFYWWNLGGWGNTRHAVERAVGGSKSILTEVSGSIQTNVWYDIKIKVSSKKVECYLNDQFIQSFDVPQSRLLYTSASLDEDRNLVYFKVVNPSDLDIETTFDLSGLNTSEVNGEQITLSSFSKYDENSITYPERVVPLTESIVAQPVELNQLIKANSVNVFKFQSSGYTGFHSDKKKAEKDFNIYPNPTNDQLLVQYSNSDRRSVQIYNLAGVRLYHGDVENGTRLDVSNFEPGLYFFDVEGLGTQKFIKQ